MRSRSEIVAVFEGPPHEIKALFPCQNKASHIGREYSWGVRFREG
jgi:hypothetical protein